MNPPPALLGAMGRERKPFTYTPGGLDLSEIKSERMAKRLMRNAMNQGVPEVPVQPIQSPPASSNLIAVPNFNCLPVQVFPTLNLPSNPKSLLRTRSHPDNPRDSFTRDTTALHKTKPSKNDSAEVTSSKIPSYQRPVSMIESKIASKDNVKQITPIGSNNNGTASPFLPEICYDAEYLQTPSNIYHSNKSDRTITNFNSDETEFDHKRDFKLINSEQIMVNADKNNVETNDKDLGEVIPKENNYKHSETPNNKYDGLKLAENELNINSLINCNALEVQSNIKLNNLDYSVEPITETTNIAAPIVDKLNDEENLSTEGQKEVKVVKKQVKKETKSETHNGNNNSEVDVEAELTVKLPTKKSAAKTETNVEVVKKHLPDGSIEEVKTTTTKTTIDGKTTIATKTETTIIPKEDDEDEEEEIVEEEEEENESEQKVEINENDSKVLEIEKTNLVENGDDNIVITKEEEHSETTTTKKVTVIQNEQSEEEEEEEEEVEINESEDNLEVKPTVDEVANKVITEKSEGEEVESKVEVEVEANAVEEGLKTENVEEIESEEEEPEQKENDETEEKENVTKTVESTKNVEDIVEDENTKEDEESEYTEEEYESEKEEPVKEEAVKEPEPVKSADVVEKEESTAPSQEETSQTAEQTETSSENDQTSQSNVIPEPEPKIPLREPSVPLEKVEDFEIKPIGPISETITKSHSENTEIIKTQIPSGPLSTQTEYNRIENIVTVNRTTKTLDHSYENLTQQGIPTVKTYFAPNRERISTSPQPSRPYQPTPVSQPTERRHSLLLERLSMERQIPTADIYHNTNQYNNTYEQQRQWSQEPQAEVINVSNVKPSTITNQQWYQQSQKENVLYNNVQQPTPTTPSQTWSQPSYQPPPSHVHPPAPQVQPPPPVIQQPPQLQYQPSYTDNTSSTKTYQQNSYSSYASKPAWGSNSINNTENISSSFNNQQNQQESYFNKNRTTDSYQSTNQQYTSSYVPPPWEQDSSYVADRTNQQYYQPPPQTNSLPQNSTQGWKPSPPSNKFSKPTPTAYIPPAPNQSFVKPVNTVEPPRVPGKKTYYSEYERRYITVPESTYVPGESKFQLQPDPSPQYYYDNNEPVETVEPEWRKELREFTEKTSQTQPTEQASIKPPWEEETKYAKTPSSNNTYNPTPTWSQTLRPQSWRERSFESDYIVSQEFPRTNTLGRGRPLSSYGKRNIETISERTRGVSVDRYNPNSYLSPTPAEHPPVQAHTLNVIPQGKNYHNPHVPAYHAQSRASAEPREQPVTYHQPRQWGDASRASPIQSRSFKYLQWITGTEH